MLTLLKIVKMYANTNSNAVYVELQPSPMPGCHPNEGGYMLHQNTPQIWPRGNLACFLRFSCRPDADPG